MFTTDLLRLPRNILVVMLQLCYIYLVIKSQTFYALNVVPTVRCGIENGFKYQYLSRSEIPVSRQTALTCSGGITIRSPLRTLVFFFFQMPVCSEKHQACVSARLSRWTLALPSLSAPDQVTRGAEADHSGLKQPLHPQHTERETQRERVRERGGGHTSSPKLHSTVCIEPFISLLGSVPELKGSYRSSLCYWCQCQRIWKDAEQGAQCCLFKYRQGQAPRDWGWTACQYRSRKHFRVVSSAKLSCTQSLTCQAPAYYVDNRVGFAKWQLKANTEHLNLRTGVFGRAACCWRERVWWDCSTKTATTGTSIMAWIIKEPLIVAANIKTKEDEEKKESMHDRESTNDQCARSERFLMPASSSSKNRATIRVKPAVEEKTADSHRGSRRCQNNGWLPLPRSGLTTHACRWGGEVRVLCRAR